MHCEKHHLTYADGLDDCPLCAREKRRAGSGPRAPEVDTGDAASFRDDIREIGRDAPADPPPAAESVQPEIAQAPDPEPVAPSAEPERLTTDPEDPTGRQVSESELRELEKNGANVVVLLGSPAAGKTWFMNRLKNILSCRRDDNYDCDPTFTSETTEERQTRDLEAHHFTPAGRGADDDGYFVIIDMPGERFERLAQGQLHGMELDLLALKICKSIILVMPADEVLLSRQASRVEATMPATEPTARTSKSKSRKASLDDRLRSLTKRHHDLTKFTHEIFRLNTILSVLQSNADVKKVAGYTLADLKRHRITKGAFQAVKKPVFVAITKADVVEGYINAIDRHLVDGGKGKDDVNIAHRLFKDREDDLIALRTFDNDPLQTVDRFRHDLVNKLQTYRWSKFDFVTSFRGHEASANRLKLNYDLSHRGVQAVIRWIAWAGRTDNVRNAAEWRHIAAARMARRFRDEGRLFPRKEQDQF